MLNSLMFFGKSFDVDTHKNIPRLYKIAQSDRKITISASSGLFYVFCEEKIFFHSMFANLGTLGPICGGLFILDFFFRKFS